MNRTVVPTRGVLFLNPRAGTLNDREGLIRAAEEKNLHVVEVHRGLDIRATVREALASGRKTFVVAGGDGSLHHVAQALVNTEGVLGVVPVGSVNHLARDLRLPVGDWRASLEIAVSGPVHQIDVGRINEYYFLNSAMIGVTTTISDFRERFRSMHSRWLAYLKAIRMALRIYPHATLVVELDGRVETFRTQMFAVSVNAYDLTATGLLASKTSFEDGRLAIYSFSFMSRLALVRAVAKYFRGRVREVPGFRQIRTAQLRVDSGRKHLRVAVDGEVLDLPVPIRIAIVPAALLIRRGDEVAG